MLPGPQMLMVRTLKGRTSRDTDDFYQLINMLFRHKTTKKDKHNINNN